MVSPGNVAPLFRLESSGGGQVSLADLTGKIVVLYFYPRDNTPGCTLEAQDFRDHLAEFTSAGAVVFGISRDSIASHCKFRDKYSLSFPLLSDSDGEMMKQYDAWGDKVMYGKKVTGVIRSTVVIDGEGKVARHWPKVNVKGHASAVLEVVRSLVSGDPVPAGTEAAAVTVKKPSVKKSSVKKVSVAPKRLAPKAAVKSAKKVSSKPMKKTPIKPAPKAPAKKAPAKKAPAKKAPAKLAKKAPAKKAPAKKAPAKKAPAKKAPAKKAR
jgi:thioredoxin-dependent peroxiredoxin